MPTASISPHYQNIVSDPEQWFAVIREQVLSHKSINTSGYLSEPERTDVERENHFKSGMFLAYDLLQATEAYIAHLKSSLVSESRESVRYAPSGMVAQLPSEVPWERLRTVTLTFSEAE